MGVCIARIDLSLYITRPRVTRLESWISMMSTKTRFHNTSSDVLTKIRGKIHVETCSTRSKSIRRNELDETRENKLIRMVFQWL